jgi:CubicO group peptidase (beta-lactamase class C family)
MSTNAPAAVTSLPHSSPESQGVAPAGISAFLDAMDAAPEIELHSLMIIRHGRVVAEGWWSPYRADSTHLLYSLSKSFASTAAAFAVAEGLLDLDATVLSYFPELDGDITDPRSRSIRVRHIAAMASGHLEETVQRALVLDPVEPVRGFLLIPPDREPGSVFAYNQPCTYALAAIVQRQSGQTLIDYLRPRLFDPLGIRRAGWQEYPPGRDLGFTGLFLSTESIARLGLLYLNRGVWNGRQLISREWVDEATREQVANPREPNPDWRRGYGFQFWMSRYGYRGDGAFGQFCLVLPEQDAVVVTTAQTENMQGILDGVWAHLVPAMGAENQQQSEAGPALAGRLSRLALVALPTGEQPRTWTDLVLGPGNGVAGVQPSLTGIRLAEDGGRWRLTLMEGDQALSSPVGFGEWATNLDEVDGGEAGVPVAVSSGWTGHETLRMDVIFLETPHRLSLTCRADQGTFDASWVTPPLRSERLAQLRMPR